MVRDSAGDEDRAPDDLIIVGVDGSDASRAALRWAIDPARNGAAVEAIWVYDPPDATWMMGLQPELVPAPDNYRQTAAQLLAEVVKETTSASDVHVAEVVAAGSPSRVLVHYASRASLLVVGAHDARGLGRLLGSTAVGCVRHATCPVVVVPSLAAHAPAAEGLVPVAR